MIFKGDVLEVLKTIEDNQAGSSDPPVKSPLLYAGGKHRILTQLIPLFPAEDRVKRFYDLFCGGLNVGINYHPNVVAVDILPQVINLYQYWRNTDSSVVLSELNDLIVSFSLSKFNKPAYNNLKNVYNSSPNPVKLYALIVHSFNHHIRFNSKGNFNMPFGFNRSFFNNQLKKTLISFLDKLHSKNIQFKCVDFFDLKNDIAEEDYVYCDPPYSITTATYNEKNGWLEHDDIRLFKFLDYLHEKNIKFGLSNVIEHDGKINQLLIDWSSKYTTYSMNVNYGNSSYHKKIRTKSKEVFITNNPQSRVY